jgi:hypothetical protein
MTKGCAYSAKTMAAVGARNAKARQSRYMVEGESLLLAEIAARLGLDRVRAGQRLKKARALPGPVTWERLKR